MRWRLAASLGIQRYITMQRLIGRLLRKKEVAIDIGPLLVADAAHVDDRVQRLIADLGRIMARSLDRRVAGTWQGSDDGMFSPHTALVSIVWPHYRLVTVPIELWAHLEPIVAQAETTVGPIHKGAPLFNVGLCHFRMGDLTRAAQYIDAAGDENKRSGFGSGRDLITGQGLGRALLLEQLTPILERRHGSDYRAVFGTQITDSELTSILTHLAGRAADAVLTLFGFWRYQNLEIGPDSYAARLQRVRILADLVLTLESSLARWQGPMAGLKAQVDTMLSAHNGAIATAFGTIDTHYVGRDWTQPITVNDMLRIEIGRFDTAPSVPEKAAAALYLVYRLRNSLQHVLEEQLDLFNDRQKLVRAMSFALISHRLAAHGCAGTLSGVK